jgi:RNA polymerase sigma-70 factor (ECF subfamily)
LEKIEELRLATNLRQAMRTLSSDDVALITLTTFEHLSSTQVGAALGISTVAARTRLHRARTRLAVALEALGPAGGNFMTKEKSE